MAGKAGIKLIDEDQNDRYGKPGREKRSVRAGSCPVCGAAGGKYRCTECGWGVTELGPELSTSMKDPVSTIMKAKNIYQDLRDQNLELKEKISALLENNRKLTELLERTEGDLEMMKSPRKEKFVYNYSDGGWKENMGVKDDKLHLRKSDVTIGDINDQLKEILKIFEKHSKINLNKTGQNYK